MTQERASTSRSTSRQATSETSRQNEDAAARRTSEAEEASSYDSVLDEIDEVLESNAEQFVKEYVQKGGE